MLACVQSTEVHENLLKSNRQVNIKQVSELSIRHTEHRLRQSPLSMCLLVRCLFLAPAIFPILLAPGRVCRSVSAENAPCTVGRSATLVFSHHKGRTHISQSELEKHIHPLHFIHISIEIKSITRRKRHADELKREMRKSPK